MCPTLLSKVGRGHLVSTIHPPSTMQYYSQGRQYVYNDCCDFLEEWQHYLSCTMGNQQLTKKHALKTLTKGHLENYLCKNLGGKEGGGYLLKGAGAHHCKFMWSFPSPSQLLQ